MIRIHAPAKVNLFLRVLAREDSGYHQLETLFSGVEFGDSLSLEVGGSGISLETDGVDLGPQETNLVYRAAKGFLELAGQDVGLRIRLVKRIPTQGGLGGGSSDAGATLKALSALFPGRVGGEDLLALAGRLGSDVPFFLSPSPLALAWGRGDRLLALPPLPRVPVLLALPPLGVATSEAYRLLARVRNAVPSPGPAGFYTLAEIGSWGELAGLAGNDFEEVVLEAFPLLGRIRRSLAETHPVFSLLSGSGSGLFALYAGESDALSAQAHLQGKFPGTRFILTHTLRESSDPIRGPGVEE
ncbi:MAG: 4-(cytidine 5'-diphospho)-2-C-methyl-D-erythritol kinase [Longimicrobiales bacterium]